MAGIVTSSRRMIGAPKFSWNYRRSATTTSGDASGVTLQAPVQVTTSYRSSGSELDTEIVDAGGSQADYFRGLFQGYLQGPRSSYDTGHPFSTIKQFVELSHPETTLTSADGLKVYKGPVIPNPSSLPDRSTFPSIPAINTGYYGPRAINETMPTSPVVNLAVALGELKREGLAHLPGLQLLKERSNVLRSVGGEYLNVEFGWKPLISDLAGFLEAVIDGGKILRQYQRDSGRLVRRRHTFKPLESTSSGTFTGSVANVSNNSNWGADFVGLASGTGTWTDTLKQEYSFSGGYTYYLQKGDQLLDKMIRYEQLANRLFGLRLTPEVVWNLAPWSWFADWNGNIGINIANATALGSDGLVLRYGYLMRTSTLTRTVQLSGFTWKTGVSGPTRVSWTSKQVQKERVQAQPFGFGSNPASYTDRQWAILAALGMTKTPRSLRP